LEKLQYYKESTKNRKCKFYPTCRYCSKELSDFFVVETKNKKIISFFGLIETGHYTIIHLCEDCFSRFHSLMEECEQENWQVLDPDSEEFEDLDNELEEENGSGK